MTDSSIVAQGYDAVYEAMPRSPTLLRLWKQHAAGEDYPDDFSHISFVTIEDLRELAGALGLSRGSRFADVACGMGGPGLWIARETGAQLFGVDFSRVAVAQAGKRAEGLGMGSSARFSVGSFAETGLETGSMDAAMSVDALQYAPDKRAAMREFARIVRRRRQARVLRLRAASREGAGPPGDRGRPGRRLPAVAGGGRLRVLSYEQTPRWHERLFAAYGAAIEAQEALREEMGEMATAAMLSEMTVTLERDIYCGRVFAIAERN